MKTILTGIFAILLAATAALTLNAVATAQGTMIGHQNPITGEVYLAAELPMGSAAEASYVVSRSDAAFVEETMGGIVIEEQHLDATSLRGINADTGRMYAMIMSGQPMVLVIATNGDTIYLIAFGGADIDPTQAAIYTRDVLTFGVNAPAPTGFVEIPVTNDFDL